MKSREIGLFLSLGISRKAVCKIVAKEHSLLFRIAALISLVMAIPVAFLCWSLLNVFLETQETSFEIGWAGLVTATVFAIISWLVLRVINYRYMKSVDIMKILKSSDENEKAKKGSLFLLTLGFLLIPIGIAMFFSLQNMTGMFICFMLRIGKILGIFKT